MFPFEAILFSHRKTFILPGWRDFWQNV